MATPWGKANSSTPEHLAIFISDFSLMAEDIRLKITNTNRDMMLTTISHELNTPINVLIGLLEVIETENHS